MAKPIFIVRVPLGKFSEEQFEVLRISTKEGLPDYHTLVIPTFREEDFQFEVFNDEGLEPHLS